MPRFARARGWMPMRSAALLLALTLPAGAEVAPARVVELEAEVAALREAAKCKTVRTEVRPVPRFDPEGEDES